MQRHVVHEEENQRRESRSWRLVSIATKPSLDASQRALVGSNTRSTNFIAGNGTLVDCIALRDSYYPVVKSV